MSLIGDVKEGKKLWAGASSITKLLIIISTFFSISTITSLSDTIFKWKGFVFDGLEFYKTFIVSPILDITESFGLAFKEGVFDYVVLCILFVSAIFRINHVSGWTKQRKWIVAILVVFIANSIQGYYEREASPSVVQIIALVLIISYFPLLDKYSRNEKFAYYTPVILSVFSVLILAAINTGLTKPL